MSPRTSLMFALTVAIAATAGAQNEKLPPVHALTPVLTAKDLMTTVSSARALPDGRVIVNDIGGRKVVIFNADLSGFTVIADTTSATANAYSSRAAGLIPWKGDSTLFVDPQSLSMIVIDPQGRMGRVMSVPRADGANSLIGGPNGTPGLDAMGRLVYRSQPNIRMSRPPAPPPSAASGTPAFPTPEFPDSAALIRIELASRKVDTVGFLKIQKPRMQVSQTPTGGMTMSSITDPMPQVDDWAVLSEGSVAMVRGQDYHVDWVRGDDQHESTGKLPFQWRHLSDSDKVAYVDSTKSAMEKLREQAVAQAAKGGGNAPIINMGDAGGGGGAGAVMVFKMEMSARDGGANPPPRGSTPGTPQQPTIPPLQFIPANELPDYAPPFAPGAARGDADGNLWIRTSYGYGGAPVYDVVSKKGDLIDRVQLPVGRVIAGFGKGCVVYMGVREGTTGARLEMAKLDRKVVP